MPHLNNIPFPMPFPPQAPPPAITPVNPNRKTPKQPSEGFLSQETKRTPGRFYDHEDTQYMDDPFVWARWQRSRCSVHLLPSFAILLPHIFICHGIRLMGENKCVKNFSCFWHSWSMNECLFNNFNIKIWDPLQSEDLFHQSKVSTLFFIPSNISAR